MNVLAYKAEELIKLLSSKYTPIRVISQKYHVTHLLKLFSPDFLNAKTMVIEESYINRDYLLDYQHYYSRCFEDYSKFCKRIHFFSLEFQDGWLNEVLVQPAEQVKENLESSYLGFIVVKPTPTRIIGYTVIVNPYTKSDNSINLWGTMRYPIHFYGVEFGVKSLAFQEQDKVVAACATTAIWIALNKAADKGRIVVKSPSEITIDAAQTSPDGSRLFPNNGLSIQQICNGFLKSGLVSEVKKADFATDKGGKQISYVSHHYLRRILHAYAPLGIPIILIIENPSSNSVLHAIAAFGYRITEDSKLESMPLINIAERISLVICHDDQWGPYSEVSFSAKNRFGIITEWTKSDSDESVIRSLVIPLYPKIRISYEDVEGLIKGINTILKYFFRQNKIEYQPEWSIQLSFSESFKNEIRNSSLDASERLSILTKHYPKYLWIAKCYLTGDKFLEFIFDATNVANGNFCMGVQFYEKRLVPLLRDTLKGNLETFTPPFLFKGYAFYEYFLDKVGLEII